MKYFGILNFCRNGISRSTRSKDLSLRSRFTIRIATLHHEILDYTMKERIIIKFLIHQLFKVISM